MTRIILSVIICLLLLAIFIGVPIWTWSYFGKPPGAGEFGDMFGSLNAIISGLAFIGVVIAIRLQSHELQLQREELKHTRDVLDKQREQLEKQANTFTRQQFDNTFFQLLRLHNDIVNAIVIAGHPADGFRAQKETVTGRDCFANYYQEFRTNYNRHNPPPPPGNLVELDVIYCAQFRYYASDFGHYFRNLYTLIKFVHQSEIPNRRFYTNIVRAQLSTYELLMLFYNCLSKFGKDKFKPLVEEYALLKNMPVTELISDSHRSFYGQQGFE